MNNSLATVLDLLLGRPRHRLTPNFSTPPALSPSPVDDLELFDLCVMREHRTGRWCVVGTPGLAAAVVR